jgi:hypothetical protein
MDWEVRSPGAVRESRLQEETGAKPGEESGHEGYRAASINSMDVLVIATGSDGVVPLSVEAVRYEIDDRHLFVCSFAPKGGRKRRRKLRRGFAGGTF